MLKTFEKNMANLGIEYVDLLLLHSPIKDQLKTSWHLLEKLHENKKCRFIGVSNFEISHLETLLKFAKIKPSVNQIELSPFLTREPLVTYCKKNDIFIQAHTSLTKGKKLDHLLLKQFGQKYDVSSAQILLKWGLQNNYTVLPRSSNPDHIKDNKNMNFDLSKEEMMELNNLNENYATHPQHLKS